MFSSINSDSLKTFGEKTADLFKSGKTHQEKEEEARIIFAKAHEEPKQYLVKTDDLSHEGEI